MLDDTVAVVKELDDVNADAACGLDLFSPPLALDLTGDGHPELVALSASGVIAALDAAGRTPDGWPLATGVGASGSMLATDLDGDGALEIVAPDRFGKLYAYSVPSSLVATASPWRMLGGDPESKVSRAHAKELLATAAAV